MHPQPIIAYLIVLGCGSVLSAIALKLATNAQHRRVDELVFGDVPALPEMARQQRKGRR